MLGGAGGVLLWQYHEQPQFCATCHIMQPYLESWQTSDLLVGAHAEEGVSCLDCHEPTLQQQVNELVVYVQGDFRVPLKDRKLPKEECFGCHVANEHGSNEQVLERTAEYTVDGEKVNPHDPHAGLEEVDSHFECYNCHKMHEESSGIDFCYGCHHAGTFQSCSDCHE